MMSLLMGRSRSAPDFDGGLSLVRRFRQYDQQIDVAVRRGIAAGMGAKQNDAQRMEIARNPVCHVGNQLIGRHGNISLPELGPSSHTFYHKGDAAGQLVEQGSGRIVLAPRPSWFNEGPQAALYRFGQRLGLAQLAQLIDARQRP